jgi:hypothetical protein
LWPAQNVTLTATTNMDVGPANFTIDIWDTELGGVVASCSTGTTCAMQTTRANVDHTIFIAVVGHKFVLNLLGIMISTVIPQAASFLDVYWHSTNLKLTETPTVQVNGTATLTAVTDQDIGPSPFFVEIYDVTAATRLTYCWTGTTCSVTVSNPTNVNNPTPTTHRYRACFTVWTGPPPGSFPPPNALECTGDHTVSWASAAPRVLLTVTPVSGGGFTATALTPLDVGPTPYWIQIYNVDSGARLALCGFGPICSATLPPAPIAPPLVAFVGPSSSTLPGPAPSGSDQSNSSTVSMAPPAGGQGAPVVSGPVLGPPGIPGGLPL